MAIQIVDAEVWIGGYRYTGSMNHLALNYSSEAVDVTAFGDTGKARKAGLPDCALQLEGFWDSTIEGAGFSDIGVDDRLITVAAGAAENDRAYMFQGDVHELELGGQIGEPHPFSIGAQASAGDKLIAGTLMENSVRSSTADGTARQLGAVSATQKLYAGIHLLTAAGSSPTFDVTVESDSSNSFSGSETVRGTFAQQTAIGSVYLTPVAGAITDTWWRMTWTLGGTSTPSFNLIAFLGIQ